MKFDFNPRPPRRGRLDKDTVVNSILLISIHAPREGGDLALNNQRMQNLISIHAPREGGDLFVAIVSPPVPCYFNPRPPRRGRLKDKGYYPDEI